MKNSNLHKAKQAKNDEFYTQLCDVEKELMHYKKHFKDKIVFCNCDDPTWSAFWEYFHLNFKELGLKKLISTHYDAENPSYKLEYEGGDDNDIEVGVKTRLLQNGDFRSDECVELLKEADIVVTNPPFSLFRPYVAQLIEYDKKFIIWGNNNAITYKEFFPLIKENKVWLGYLANKTCIFRLDDSYEKYDEKITAKMNDGHKYGKVPAISTFTNLDIPKRHEKLILWKKYTPEEYQKYDNYDAINVNKVAEIPVDYDGVMGVPITFLDKYNPEQFEVVELSRYLKHDGMSKKFVELYYLQGGKAQISEGHPDLCYYDGKKAVIPYMRILIKQKRGNLMKYDFDAWLKTYNTLNASVIRLCELEPKFNKSKCISTVCVIRNAMQDINNENKKNDNKVSELCFLIRNIDVTITGILNLSNEFLGIGLNKQDKAIKNNFSNFNTIKNFRTLRSFILAHPVDTHYLDENGNSEIVFLEDVLPYCSIYSILVDKCDYILKMHSPKENKSYYKALNIDKDIYPVLKEIVNSINSLIIKINKKIEEYEQKLRNKPLKLNNNSIEEYIKSLDDELNIRYPDYVSNTELTDNSICHSSFVYIVYYTFKLVFVMKLKKNIKFF